MTAKKKKALPEEMTLIGPHEAKVALATEIEENPLIKALQNETPKQGTYYMACHYSVSQRIPGLKHPKILEFLWSEDRSKVIEGMLLIYAYALIDCYHLYEEVEPSSVDAVIAAIEAQGDVYPPAKRKALANIKRWVNDMRHPHQDGLDAGNIWEAAKGSGLSRIFDIGDFEDNVEAINMELNMKYGRSIEDIHNPPSYADLMFTLANQM